MKEIFKKTIILALVSTTATFAMTNAEWEQYKKDCNNAGGSPGVHADGSPGCCHVHYVGDLKKVNSYKDFKNYKGSIKFKGVEAAEKIKSNVRCNADISNKKKIPQKVLRAESKDRVQTTKCKTKF